MLLPCDVDFWSAVLQASWERKSLFIRPNEPKKYHLIQRPKIYGSRFWGKWSFNEFSGLWMEAVGNTQQNILKLAWVWFLISNKKQFDPRKSICDLINKETGIHIFCKFVPLARRRLPAYPLLTVWCRSPLPIYCCGVSIGSTTQRRQST